MTICEDEKMADVTLIMPRPIPQIHLTCKELAAEAAPFLRKVVEKQRLSRTAPKMIVSGNCGEFAAEVVAMIIKYMKFDIFDIPESLISKYWQDTCKLDGDIRAQLESTHAHKVSVFCKNASKHLLKTKEVTKSWLDEAFEYFPLLIPRGSLFHAPP